MEQSFELIRSRQNRTVVEAAKLTDRKVREATKRFRFDGIKLLEEALSNRLELTHILLRESNSEAIKASVFHHFGDHALAAVDRVLTLSDEVFDKISEEKSPEGIFCVAKHLDSLHNFATIYNGALGEHCFAAVSVRDPGNLGTLMRTAAALGIDTLILSSDCADVYSPKTLRASMGALFRLKTVRCRDINKTLESLPENSIIPIAASLSDKAGTLGISPLPDNVCFVVGNEGHGLPQDVIASCAGGEIIIPMETGAESLNVSAAASILLWEDYRRRIK